MSKSYWPTRPGVRNWDFPKDEEGKIVADAIELEDVADLHDPNAYYDPMAPGWEWRIIDGETLVSGDSGL